MEAAVVRAAFEQIRNDARALAMALDLPTGAARNGDRRVPVGAAASDPWTGPPPSAPPNQGRSPQGQISDKDLRKALAVYAGTHVPATASGFSAALKDADVQCSRERARAAFAANRKVARGRPKRAK